MKQKPFVIKFFTFCFLVAPIFNLTLMAWFNHWPWTGPRSVFQHLSFYEVTMLCFFPITAFGIWRVAKWGYYLFLGFSMAIIVNNFYFLITQKLYSSYVALLFQATTLSAVGFFLQKHITAPYFNPKMRWWESKPRFKMDKSCGLKISPHDNGTFIDSYLVDLSRGGCFVICTEKLKPGQNVEVRVQNESTPLYLIGEIVWCSDQIKNGYGIRFLKVGLMAQQSIKKILNEHKEKKAA
jgi:Tfp pilus assembly protein PilZ